MNATAVKDDPQERESSTRFASTTFLDDFVYKNDNVLPRHKEVFPLFIATNPGIWEQKYSVRAVERRGDKYVVLNKQWKPADEVSFAQLEASASKVAEPVWKEMRLFPVSYRGDHLFGIVRDGKSPEDALSEAQRFRREQISSQSYWRRDTGTLDVLGCHLLPRWKVTRPMKVASVGCSTGVEPVSLLLMNWADRERIKVSGFDINAELLQEARRGKFDVWTDSGFGDRKHFDDYPEQVQKAAFRFRPSSKKNYETVTLTPEAASRLTYHEADILAAPLAEKQDAIFIRFVLMHFSAAGKMQAAENLFNSLEPGGRVILNAPQDDADGPEKRTATISILKAAGFKVEPVNLPFLESTWRYTDRVVKKPK